ncbi:MAG TPA: cytochrome b N-terminal domain-containing protein [Vicinamibacterales bacterium]|jgi:ubiquinol-cytochrome c reductase cytochrome b subunit
MGVLRRTWAWIDDVTGLSASLGPILTHLVPRAQKTRWLYVFGSATLAVFIVQVGTGIALSSAYVTGSGQAYDSLLFISRSRVGSVIRGIHYFGASAMIVLIGIHAIRTYLMASYKHPRQVNWLTGAALLMFTILMAFTGQLLRWDQGGFWTAVVAAEQAGKTPFIGHWLGHFLLAGDTAGGATLSRFFAAHVFFIPAFIFAFLGFHLYLVLHNGISEPPKAGRPVDPRTYRTWYHAMLKKDGVPFWPDAAWRDLFFAMLIVILVVMLGIFVGAPALGKPPDPTIIQASPRPDWYFLWYFALLSMIPKWMENFVIVGGPAVFGLFLILLPFFGGKGERSPLRRPWSILIVAFIVTIIGYYWHMGVLAPWSPRMDAPPLPPAVVGVTTGSVADGARVFHQKGCEYCHLVSGYGGIRGPDLSDAGDRMTRAEIATRIFSGAQNMPSYTGNMSPQDLTVLLDFLESRHLKPPAATKRFPPR